MLPSMVEALVVALSAEHEALLNLQDGYIYIYVYIYIYIYIYIYTYM